MLQESEKNEQQSIDNEDARLQFALSALNLAMMSLSMLGYELTSRKIEFRKIKDE